MSFIKLFICVRPDFLEGKIGLSSVLYSICKLTNALTIAVAPNQGSTDTQRVRKKLAGGRECNRISQS